MWSVTDLRCLSIVAVFNIFSRLPRPIGRLSALVITAVLFSLNTHRCQALDRKPTNNPHTNYVLYCAGCHGLTGEGAIHHVPNLIQSLPLLLQVPGGRQFAVSVPGVVNSELDSTHLTQVFNYLREEWSLGGEPFTTSEIEAGRQHPILRVHQSRAALLGISNSDPGTVGY